MRISVIIPTYNRADLLRDAIQSVLAQTHNCLEIIVVDDGSNDNTGEVLAEFGDRIQAIRLGRSGISAARNAGIEAATGEYLAFLDSDDLWLPTKIQQQLAFALAHPEVVLIYTDALEFRKDSVRSESYVEHFHALSDPSDLFAPMITSYAIPLTSTAMIRTSFLRETGLRFPTKVSIGEDLALFLQILMAGGKFGYLPERLTMRRMHDSNESGNHCRRFRQRKLLYFDLLRTSGINCTPKQRSALNLGLRDATYRVAECDWENSNFSEARRGFFVAMGMDATGVRALAYGILTFLPSTWISSARRLKHSA